VSDLGKYFNCFFHLVLICKIEKLLHDNSHFFELFSLNFVKLEEVAFQIQLIRIVSINDFGKWKCRKD
jgi:hypothetical protein